MPGRPKHIFLLRLALATVLALLVPWTLGPPDVRYRMYVLSLAVLALLGGIIRAKTKEGGLKGEMATGAMALLMLTPAVGVRNSRVADAVFSATHIAPHEALLQLPHIAQAVPNACGPLLLGAGLAMLAICGRLGAIYAGIAFGGAAAAWMGQSMAIETGQAMRTERFEEAVLLSQTMRFVGISVLLGLVAGFPFQQRGRIVWRKAMHKFIHDQRYAEKLQVRNEEIARVEAAQAELRAREAAAEAKAKAAEEEANKGVQIDGLEEGGAPVQDDPSDEEEPAKTADYTGDGGGFGEEDGEFEADPDDEAPKKEDANAAKPLADADNDEATDAQATDAQATDAQATDAQATDAQASDEESNAEPELAPLELEPRFDIESPIVVEVSEEDVNPDATIDAKSQASMRRIIAGMVTICCLTAGWSSTPPWFSVLSALPDPHTTVAVPITDPGLSIARPPMDPFHKEFDRHLENRKHHLMHGSSWACLADTANYGKKYGSTDRAIEPIAIPADTPLLDLYPAIQTMRRRGVYRVGITGRADPPYGPLGALFAWPAVQILTDRPPRAIQWFELHPRRLKEVPLLPGRADPPTACALLVQPDVTVQHLYQTVRSLGSVYGDKRCRNGIAVVFPEDGTTTNSNPAWRGCP